MSGIKNLQLDCDALEAFAKANPLNEYVLRDCRGNFNHQSNPLHLFYLNEHRQYLVKVNDDGLIVAALMYCTEEKRDDQSNARFGDSVTISVVNTHPDYPKQGYAKDLINTIFKMAQDKNLVLHMTGFEDDGLNYLAGPIRAIHAQYPDVPVLYHGERAPVKGHKPYRYNDDLYPSKIEFI